MARLVNAVSIVTLIGVLTACGGSAGHSPEPPPSPPPPPPPPIAINRAPMIEGMPAESVLVGATYDLLPSATDPDGNSMSFSVQRAPRWADFDPETGHLSGVPGETDPGLYDDIDITVSDGIDSASLDPFSIQVSFPLTGLDSRPQNSSCLAVIPSEPANVRLLRVFPNLVLSRVTSLIQAPGIADAWYFTTQNGLIGRFENRNDINGFTTVLDLTDVITPVVDGGILQIAFHPDFPADRRFFLHYSVAPSGPWTTDAIIASYLLCVDGRTANRQSERIILRQRRDQFHQGGFLKFDNDGYLLVGTGDGTDQGDPFGISQNPSELRGKILRLDIDRGGSYSIPPDNPFVGSGGVPREEIFAIGVRNPFRGDVDPLTGRIYIGDVGFNSREEVSQVFSGANLGWNVLEGTKCFSQAYGDCTDPSLFAPLLEYTHAGGNCAVIGGLFYLGNDIPALTGRFLFSDYCSGKVSAVELDGNGSPVERVLVSAGTGPERIVAFARD